jgi:hypothetical protein
LLYAAIHRNATPRIKRVTWISWSPGPLFEIMISFQQQVSNKEI